MEGVYNSQCIPLSEASEVGDLGFRCIAGGFLNYITNRDKPNN